MISIIIPTFNERENLPRLIESIFSHLGKTGGEVVVVDDNSPDATGDLAEALKREYPIQVIHRSGKLGLASAVLEGFKQAQGGIVCVMDADLSHDPAILPRMVKAVEEGTDLVVGSRHVPGGGTKGWPKYRKLGSGIAILLARPITPVKDATSGYFCFRRSILNGVQLDGLGFKIGLEIFVKGKCNRFTEIPYIFQDRTEGKSKLSQKVVLHYLRHLWKLYLWKLAKLFAPPYKHPP